MGLHDRASDPHFVVSGQKKDRYKSWVMDFHSMYKRGGGAGCIVKAMMCTQRRGLRRVLLSLSRKKSHSHGRHCGKGIFFSLQFRQICGVLKAERRGFRPHSEKLAKFRAGKMRPFSSDMYALGAFKFVVEIYLTYVGHTFREEQFFLHVRFEVFCTA